MPCPVISPSHLRVPPKRPSMQMDWPSHRQMLRWHEHGRLLMKSRGARSCVKQRRVRGWQTVSPGTLQTFVLGSGFQFEPGGCDVTSSAHGEPATPLSSRCGAVRFEGEPCVVCASRSEIAASVGNTCQKSAWASHAWCAMLAKIGTTM